MDNYRANAIDHMNHIIDQQNQPTTQVPPYGEVMIPVFLNILNQTKIFHWHTLSYSAHKILQEYYETIDGLVDRYVEVYKGSCADKNPEIENFTVTCLSINSVDMFSYYTEVCKSIEELAKSTPIDLQNIAVDMLEATKKLNYLLKMT